MTAVERAFLRRLKRRAARLSPDLVRRELVAYELIRESLTERELIQAIRTGQVDRLILELMSEERMEPSFVRLRARIDATLVESTTAEAGLLPPGVRPGAFNIFNPRLIQAAQLLNTRVIDGLKETTRMTVMQHVERGLTEGVGPRTIARGVRDAIGLAPNQEQAAWNFRRMLLEQDPTLFRRKLRDRRFDATIKKAFASGQPLTRAQVDRMTSVYRRRFIAHNAETHARTIANDAQKLAQRMAWQDAIDRGVVSRNALIREWIAVGGPHGDGRNRPEHLALHGTKVGFDEPYPNGELVPGDSTYNCRCVDRIRLQTSARRRAA